MSAIRRVTRAVIPAAGKGTRLFPLTKAVPKELMPIGRHPILEHVMEEAARCGIAEALFVISEEKTAIRTHFGAGANGIRFDYVMQPEQRGLADAIHCSRDWVGRDPFAVLLADSIIQTQRADPPFARVLDCFARNPAQCVILVQETRPEELSRYGIVRPILRQAQDESGWDKGEMGCYREAAFEIDRVFEKPRQDEAPSAYAVAGRYVFDPVIFEHIERTSAGALGEYQISDSINLMLEAGGRGWCVPLGAGEVRIDIGTFETYFEAFQVELERLSRPQEVG